MSNPSRAHPNSAAAEPCRECRRPLPRGAAQGFCPYCAFQEMDGALEEDGADFDAVPLRRMGNYELLEVIGRGGMGTVYRAQHVETGVVRALKVISAGELASAGLRRRFLQEAGTAAALAHPHIVIIHELSAQDGMPFYVMDYVSGRTLAEAVKDKPMPPHAAAACMARVASAIHHAHECGVLHRDLKPSNILLDESGEPRVTDFGLACQVNAKSSLTASQQILGTPAWMSPEQAAGKGKQAGPGADVYSLGAVLYHLVTGQPPFRGDSPPQVLRQVLEHDPVPPHRLQPAVPRDLETVVLKCMEKNPARRYASAAALEADLQRFLTGEPVLARPVSRAGRLARRARRYPAVAALSVLLAATLIAGMVWILHSNRQLRRSDTEKSTALTEKEATLAESLLWQAEFQRLTGKPGQREGSLAAIKSATKLPLTPEQTRRARHAAIAALALPDAQFVPDARLPVPEDASLFLTDPFCRYYAAATRDGRITVIRLSDGSVVREVKTGASRINALLRWSEDGKYLAYRCNDTQLAVLLLPVGDMLRLPGLPDLGDIVQLDGIRWTADVWPAGASPTLNQVAFHPPPLEGLMKAHRLVHPDPQGGIIQREAFSGLVYRRIPPPAGEPTEWRALAWDIRGQRLAAATGSQIVIWDMEADPPVELRRLTSAAPVESLDWEAQETSLLAGDIEGRLTIWNPQTGLAPPPLAGHAQPILSSATGRATYRHVSASKDGTIRVWDRTAYRPLLTLPGQAGRVFLTDGGEKAGPVLHDGRVGWYHIAWPECLRVLNPAEASEGVRAVAWSDGGSFAVSLTGRAAVVRKVNPISAQHLAIPHDRPSAVAWVPGARWLAVAAADGLHTHVLRTTDRTPLAAPLLMASPKILEGPCSDVSFNPEGTLMAVVRESSGTLELYRTDPAETRRTWRDSSRLRLHERLWSVPVPQGTRCRIAPDSRWLATGSPGAPDACIYHAASGKVAHEPLAARAAHNWLPVFSRDGTQLLFGGRTAHVLRCGQWEQCEPLNVPPNYGPGQGVAFVNEGEDEEFLAAVGADEEIHLFRRDNPGEPIAMLRAPAAVPIGALEVSPAGLLSAATPRGEVHVWTLPSVRRGLELLGLSWENRAAGAVR